MLAWVIFLFVATSALVLSRHALWRLVHVHGVRAHLVRDCLVAFFAGTCLAYIGLILILVILSTALGDLATGDRGLLATTGRIIFRALTILAAANGITWGLLVARRPAGGALPWKGMVISTIIVMLMPLGLYLVVPAAAVSGTVVLQLWFDLLVALPVLASLAVLVYFSFRLSAPPAPAPARAPTLQPEFAVPLAPTALLPSYPFATGLVGMVVVVWLCSALFLLVAYFIMQHWASARAASDVSDLSGLVEIMALIGVQAVISIVCFVGAFAVTAGLGFGARIRAHSALLRAALLALLATVLNLISDATGAVVLGLYLGVLPM